MTAHVWYGAMSLCFRTWDVRNILAESRSRETWCETMREHFAYIVMNQHEQGLGDFRMSCKTLHIYKLSVFLSPTNSSNSSTAPGGYKEDAPSNQRSKRENMPLQGGQHLHKTAMIPLLTPTLMHAMHLGQPVPHNCRTLHINRARMAVTHKCLSGL